MNRRENEANRKAYAKKLIHFVKSPVSEMLLNANDYHPGSAGLLPEKQAAFILHSSRVQREFVTIWELFDHDSEFDECMDELAIEAKRLRELKSSDDIKYTAIATCTATSKHLLNYIHAKVELPNEPIDTHYLGEYPYMNSQARSLLSFEGQRVLILTDVIASGTLVRKMAELVSHLGGIPVCALSVLMVRPKLIETRSIQYKAKDQELSIDLYSLGDFPIVGLQIGDYDKNKVVEIDPFTIQPGTRNWEKSVKKPLKRPDNKEEKAYFNFEEMLRHFEAMGTLDFRFFSAEGRWYTHAIRIRNLVETEKEKDSSSSLALPFLEKMTHEHADENRMELINTLDKKFVHDTMPQSPILVTTFDLEDIRFLRFFRKQFDKDLGDTKDKAVFLSRCESVEESYRFFMQEKDKRMLRRNKNANLVVLLATANTSEKIRKIVTLLADMDPKRISVLCLINRMGSVTGDFIKKLHKLLGRSTNGIDFDFSYVYGITEIDNKRLADMQDMITSLFDRYVQQTRASSFIFAANSNRKYFRPASHTSLEFDTRTPRPIVAPRAGEIDPTTLSKLADLNTSLKVSTLGGCLFYLHHLIVSKRNYEEALKFVDIFYERGDIYKLFSLMVADSASLKARHHTSKHSKFNEINEKKSAFNFITTQVERKSQKLLSRAWASSDSHDIEFFIDQQTNFLCQARPETTIDHLVLRCIFFL